MHTIRRPRGILIALVAVLFFDFMMLYLRQGPEEVGVDVLLNDLRASASPTGNDASAPHDDSASDNNQDSASEPDTDVSPQPGAPASPDGDSAPPSPKATASATRSNPRAGVYEFATQGYERAEVLGGSQHDYPATSYISIKHSACGITTRWQPLRERWDETQLCGNAARSEIRAFMMYHEFFQRGKTDMYHCAPGAAVVYDRDKPVGARWTARCDGAGGGITMTVTVVGIEAVTVGSKTVQAVHVRYDGVVTGDSDGTQIQHRWFDPADGLLLRLTSEAKVRTKTPFGETDYSEQYRIDLNSLTPRT